jgi:hypothetical protein
MLNETFYKISTQNKNFPLNIKYQEYFLTIYFSSSYEKGHFPVNQSYLLTPLSFPPSPKSKLPETLILAYITQPIERPTQFYQVNGSTIFLPVTVVFT